MKKLLQQALDALENSIDIVSNGCQDYIDLYSKYPTRAAKIDAKLAEVKAHEAAIEALRAELDKPEPEPVAWLVSFQSRLSGVRVTDKLLVWRKSQAAEQVKEDLIERIEPLYLKEQL